MARIHHVLLVREGAGVRCDDVLGWLPEQGQSVLEMPADKLQGQKSAADTDSDIADAGNNLISLRYCHCLWHDQSPR